MTGLLESLAEDEKAAKEAGLNLEGEESGKETKDGDSYDSAKSRTRIASRRARRNAAPSSQDESGTPSDDGGTSRGPRGDTSGSGESTSGDAQTSLGDGSTPRSSEELLESKSEEEPKTASEWVKYRKKLREAEAEKNRLARELAEARSAPKPEVKIETPVSEEPTYEQWLKANPKPDKEKDLAGYLVWNAERQEQKEAFDSKERAKTQEQQKRESLYKSAEAEVAQIQEDYKKENPDYENAISFAKQEYAAAVKKLMPNLTKSQIEQAINKEIFNVAIQCARDGTNLGETLYDMCIERFGYQPNTEISPKAKHPNLRVISNNQKRSASPLEGGGQKGQGRVTIQQASQMSPAELMALPAEDLQWLEAQGF